MIKKPVIFVRTRYHYDSYTDFWRLVELSGFPTCYVDEVNPDSGAMYILSPYNGEWAEHINTWGGVKPVNTDSTYVLWNLERPGGSGGLEEYKLSNRKLLGRGMLHRVMVSDKQLAFDTQFDYIALGSHPDLGMPGHNKQYDLIHLSCYSNHRAWLFDNNPAKTHSTIGTLSIAPNGWGQHRHEALQASRAMLATHQDKHKYIEPLRYAIAVAYGLPIIAEWSHNFYPYNGPGLFVYSERSDLNGVVRAVLDDYGMSLAKAFHMRQQMMDNFTFKKGVLSYLNQNFPIGGGYNQW